MMCPTVDGTKRWKYRQAEQLSCIGRTERRRRRRRRNTATTTTTTTTSTITTTTTTITTTTTTATKTITPRVRKARRTEQCLMFQTSS